MFLDPSQISFDKQISADQVKSEQKEIVSASFKSVPPANQSFTMAPPIINSGSKDKKFSSMADQFKMGSHGQASSGSYGGLFSG